MDLGFSEAAASRAADAAGADVERWGHDALGRAAGMLCPKS